METTSPRDNRMGWRRVSVRGSLTASPPSTDTPRAIPLCLRKLWGFGGKAPIFNGAASTELTPASSNRWLKARGDSSANWLKGRPYPHVFGACGWVASPPFVGNEIADGYRLVAVGTTAAWAHPATETLAVRAALLAQIARPTRRTLVHCR